MTVPLTRQLSCISNQHFGFLKNFFYDQKPDLLKVNQNIYEKFKIKKTDHVIPTSNILLDFPEETFSFWEIVETLQCGFDLYYMELAATNKYKPVMREPNIFLTQDWEEFFN